MTAPPRLCRHCGAPIVNPLALATRASVCSAACADALGRRLANGTRIERYAWPEDVFRVERVHEHSRRLVSIAAAGAKLKDVDKKALAARVKALRKAARELDHVRRVKDLSFKCGRTLYDREKHAEARAKLRAALATLDVPTLRYWARVVLIDHRFNGATGQGGFIAVASRCANELAREVLAERGRGKPVFQVLAESPGMHGAERREDAA